VAIAAYAGDPARREEYRRFVTDAMILAMGGGGFTMEPDTPALDDFVLTLAERREPRILFLPTASGDPREQIARFHATFDDRPCEPSVLSVFRLADLRRPLREIVLSQDIVYVGGGSMRNLLALWRLHQLDALLAEAWARGTVLAGFSAGAMCWFEGGVTTSFGPPEPTTGLGLLPGSLSVHADGQPGRRPVFLGAVADGTLPAGYLVDDGVGLVFRDTALERAVSSCPQARAVRVERVAGGVVETPVLPQYLPSAAPEHRPTPFDILEFRRAYLGASRRE
jgi:dipeptidase E